MHSHAQKTSGNERQSAANTSAAQQQAGSGFADNRSIAIQMRRLQELAGNSAAVKQLKAMQAMANQGAQAEQLKDLLAMGSNDGQQGPEQPIQKKRNDTGLPDNLKAGIENMSGYAMDDVKVHYNSDKPAGLNAHAYAQGTDIHVASGQEKHLPHEAWHVVQQKQGRVKPTLQLQDGAYVNDDAGLENEADVMGEKSIQMFAAGPPDKDALLQQEVNNAGGIFQRVVAYKGVQYKVPQTLYDENPGLMARLMDDNTKDFKIPTLNTNVKDPGKVYKLDEHAPGKFTLTETTDAVEGALTAAAAATHELDLPVRKEQYTNEKTYSVKIDEGAAVVEGKGDPVEVIGTSGLRGCVAVMIICERRSGSAYFVAHVSSEKANHLDMVAAEIDRILSTMNEALNEQVKMKWSDFHPQSPNRLLLAREKNEDETLFLNMQEMLAKSGAKMLATRHGNIAINIHSREFIRHEAEDEDAAAPELPYDNEVDALKGYGNDEAHWSRLMKSLVAGGVDPRMYMNRPMPPPALRADAGAQGLPDFNAILTRLQLGGIDTDAYMNKPLPPGKAKTLAEIEGNSE